MATIALSKRDLNRFIKIYPYVRFEKREVTNTSEGFKVETGVISFVNESSKTYSFTESYTSIPTISAISVSTSENADVNVYITAISINSVTFEASAPFTGQISFSAIQVA